MSALGLRSLVHVLGVSLFVGTDCIVIIIVFIYLLTAGKLKKSLAKN